MVKRVWGFYVLLYTVNMTVLCKNIVHNGSYDNIVRCLLVITQHTESICPFLSHLQIVLCIFPTYVNAVVFSSAFAFRRRQRGAAWGHSD